MPPKKSKSSNPLGALPIPLVPTNNPAGPPAERDVATNSSEWTAPSSVQAQLEPTTFGSSLQTTPLRSGEEVTDTSPERMNPSALGRGRSRSRSMSVEAPLRQQWVPQDYSAGIREARDAVSESHGMVGQITQGLGKLASARQRVSAGPVPDAAENSTYQGKAIDPRNWGGLDIPQSELNPETQRAAFVSYQDRNHGDAELRRTIGLLAERIRQLETQTTTATISRHEGQRQGLLRPLSSEISRMIGRNVSSERHDLENRGTTETNGRYEPFRARRQIAQDSYLGRAFQRLSESPERRRLGQRPRRPQARGTVLDDGSSDDDKTHHKKVPLSKPKDYDGTDDPFLFFQFITQSMAYIKEGQIPVDIQINKISYFLKGKAYKFYSSEVAYDVDNWTLEDFFNELFNYCFPPDLNPAAREAGYP